MRNIANFQTKLSKIRESALFLGDISIFHERALKSTQNKNKELKDNQKFLEEMILKERVTRKKLKEAISRESTEADLLYAQAQDFMLHCKDEAKVKQLLSMLDDDRRSTLMQSLQPKSHEPPKAIEAKNPLKRYDGIKIQNFVQQLNDLGLDKEHFAEEVQNYFQFHSMRKEQAIASMQQQLLREKETYKRLL